MKKVFYGACLIVLVLLIGGQELFAKGWEHQKSGVISRLNAVSFVDSDHGWTVGENGVILGTTDGGLNWKTMSPMVPYEIAPTIVCPRKLNFRSVYFVDRENGWVAGEMSFVGVRPDEIKPYPVRFAVIFRTRDGGKSWECQYPCKILADSSIACCPRLTEISDIFLLNELNGWAVGDGFYYLATEDGGKSWKEMPIGFWAIPETRHYLTATKWISPKNGWVSGYHFNMFSPIEKSGFIARTEDGGETWKIDPLRYPTFAPIPALNDLEIIPPRANTDIPPPPAWSVGERGTILHLTSEGWEPQTFPWPLSLPIPDFNAVAFSDEKNGWIVGYREQGFVYEDAMHKEYMTVLQTADAGETWRPDFWNVPGRLNDVETIAGVDVWAVGDNGVILHYGNHAPEICRAWAEPPTVYSGRTIELYVSVKDMDGPSDIRQVLVDAGSIGAGIVQLKPAWESADDRRCVLYQGKVLVSPLASYGMHTLPVEAIDMEGAFDSGQIEVFVITSWVEIEKTWAIPNPVLSGRKVMLAAEVGIVAPKGLEDETIFCPHNKVKKVTVDITELLGVDCADDMDCIMVVEMTDPDGDGIYTYVVAPVTGGPGKYRLPVWAVDTLGHRDKAEIFLRVFDIYPCYFDIDHDGDVDGLDLSGFAKQFYAFDKDFSLLGDFAGEFNSIDCVALPRIGEYSNSGCISQYAFDSEDNQYPFCGDDEIEVTVEGQSVSIVHMNATYNCCPDDILVSMSLEGDVIKVTEKETGGYCNCLCCYDVRSTVVDLTPGTYTFEYCWFDYETGKEECFTQEIEVR